MDLRFALSLSGNESLQMTNTWRGKGRGPRGRQTLKEQCYESRHLINNYKKNLFHSFTLTPDGQAIPLKDGLSLLSQKWYENVAFDKESTYICKVYFSSLTQSRCLIKSLCI